MNIYYQNKINKHHVIAVRLNGQKHNLNSNDFIRIPSSKYLRELVKIGFVPVYMFDNSGDYIQLS